MSEHTPTPWQRNSPQQFHIYGPDDELCATGHSLIHHDRALANAKLIVKAVNAYGPLVETVKSISQFTTDEVVKRIALQTLKDIGEDAP